MNTPRGNLHLIPVALGDTDARLSLPSSALQAAAELDYFLVENEKSARQFLKNIAHPRPLQELQLERFDKDSDLERATALLQPLLAGRSAGILSEAGSPAVADPGALLVEAATRDDMFVAAESAAITRILAERFQLSSAATADLF